MQVPESFFHRSPSLEPNRKKESSRAQPADDSFRKMMAEDRRKIKDTDVDAKKSNSEMAEVEDTDEDQEFSIFKNPKKRPRPTKNPASLSQQSSKQPRTRDSISDLVATAEPEVEEAPEALPELPPEEPQLINKQKFTPTGADQQSHLDNVKENAGYVFVDKKDKPGVPKFEVPNSTPNKASKKDDSPKIVPENSTEEPAETPSNDIINGKHTIKEQQSEPQKQTSAPGSKENHTKFQATLEKQAAEFKNALGNTDQKDNKNVKDLPKATQQKTEKSDNPDEQPRAKKQGPVDARSVAFAPVDALPKEKGEITVNSEQPVQKAPLAAKLQEIVDQIVKEIYTLSDNGSSETTIILQNPPLFNGVKVVIETFANAPNQINITFTNLTGPGKRLLDENLASLKTGIEHNAKGMVVQQLTTSTVDEVPRYVADAQQSEKERDQQGNQSGSQKDNNDSDDEDQAKRRKSK